MVKTIEPQAFDVELESRSGSFVVAFIKRNEKFADQVRALGDVSQAYADHVRCYLYDVDYLDTAMQRFMVNGTPTFLFFANGREVDRLIGESDKDTLDEFVSTNINA